MTDKLEKLQKLIDRLPKNYADLLIRELNIITDNGVANFLPYFVTLKEIVDIAKEIDALKGPARGSAAASLVSYLFGITDLDPVVHDLPLSRFISVPRLQRSVPDVDTDFGSVKRDDINKIIFDRYGDRAAAVAVFSFQKLKNSLMDGWRIFIVQPNRFKISKLNHEGKKDEANALKDHLDRITKEFNDVRKSLGSAAPVGFTEMEWLEGCTKDEEYHPGLLETNSAFKEWCAKYPEVLTIAKSILAIPRQIGKHAAGVVISDVPLHEIVPVMKVDGINVIAYDKKVLQKLGLIKFDNLAVTAINYVQDTLAKLKKKGIILDPWELPEKAEVYEEYMDGACRSIFQFDTTGGARFAKKLKPHSKQDLFAGVALNRPGAMDAKITTSSGITMSAADGYIKRFHGEIGTEYIHDDLIPALKDTHAVIVYQESVARIIQDFFGYSEEESDVIRAAISDKKPEVFEEVKKRLPMLLAKGWTQQQANDLYETLLAFARFAFNKSHSAAYGTVSYTTAYLKHFYPLEWWSSVLSNCKPEDVIEKFWPEVSKFLDEPDINLSKLTYEIKGDRLVPPLNLISGLGKEGLKDITSKAPYSSFEDFIQRIDSRKTNKKVILSLLKAGAMNALFEPNMSLTQKVNEYRVLKSLKEGKKKIEDMPEEFLNLTPYKEYLLNKSVMPVSNISLTDAILKTENIEKNFAKIGNTLMFRGKLPLFTGQQFADQLAKADELEDNIPFVAYGYVIALRQFTYYSEKLDMTKMALEVILDLDGHQVKHVCWPRRADKEPLLAKILREKTAYLFNIQISNNKDWPMSISGIDEIKEKKS